MSSPLDKPFRKGLQGWKVLIAQAFSVNLWSFNPIDPSQRDGVTCAQKQLHACTWNCGAAAKIRILFAERIVRDGCPRLLRSFALSEWFSSSISPELSSSPERTPVEHFHQTSLKNKKFVAADLEKCRIAFKTHSPVWKLLFSHRLSSMGGSSSGGSGPGGTGSVVVGVSGGSGSPISQDSIVLFTSGHSTAAAAPPSHSANAAGSKCLPVQEGASVASPPCSIHLGKKFLIPNHSKVKSSQSEVQIGFSIL